MISTSAPRDIVGTGQTSADLQISEADPYDFGTQAIGSSNLKTFTLTNNGAFEASAIAGVSFGTTEYDFFGGSFPGTGGSCLATTLAGASTCSFVVEYVPSASALEPDTVTINYNNGVGPTSTTRTVQGTGETEATLTLSLIHI